MAKSQSINSDPSRTEGKKCGIQILPHFPHNFSI
jgi:hypothetical protein